MEQLHEIDCPAVTRDPDDYRDCMDFTAGMAAMKIRELVGW